MIMTEERDGERKKMKDGETMCIRIKYLEGMEVKINYRVLGDRQRKKRLKL